MDLTNLRQKRIEKGITYKEMAAALDISFQYYWMIENGKRGLSYEMAVKIAKVLETTPDQLFLSVSCEQE